MDKELIVIGIILILIFVGLCGCVENKSKDNISTQNIMTNMMSSLEEVNSYSIAFDGTITTNNVKTGITEGYAELDIGNKKMKNVINLTISMPGSASTNTQIYVIDNIEYTNHTETSSSSKLTKKNITENMWNNYDLFWNQNELNEISKIERLEDETINNINCFVIKIIPDIEKYLQVKENFNESFGSGRTLNGIEIKYWIGKEDYLPVKIYSKLDMFTSTPIYGDMIEIYENEDLCSNYNADFIIEIPNWAIDATWI